MSARQKVTGFRLQVTVALLLTLFTITCPLSTVSALNVASTYRVSDNGAQSGDIITDASGKGLIRATITYDQRLFGVIEDDPLAVYRNTNADSSERPIIRSGDVAVNVVDFNGKIGIGDYITSSPIAGKGMKATQSGYVIGLATSNETEGAQVDYQGKKYTTGTITVALNIEYAEISTAKSTVRLFEAINAAIFRNVQDPEKFTTIARYIIAGFIAILSFVLGFGAFSRSVAKGIEAIGRNPLAKGAIQSSIILEVGMTVVTCLAGVVLAFIIIKF